MLKVPYIRIRQRAEVFFLTSIRADVLIPRIQFHFRAPYFQNQQDLEGIDEYMRKVRKKGLELSATDEGIQRRLQLDRIQSVKSYLTESKDTFFPNAVILSANSEDIPQARDSYEAMVSSVSGELELPDDIRFSVIDGQHRLAGISLVGQELRQELEIPVVLLFDVSIPTAAKLFSDINGKQKAVNRSLIYDLQEQIDPEKKELLTKIHDICKAFYTERSSPLYRQIKMLGLGNGSISQAFFVDYVVRAIESAGMADEPTQTIYDQFFYYFRSFQKVFPEDWPVPLATESDLASEVFANQVLKVRRSQLAKTNGFGAILLAFPPIYSASDKSFSGYERLVRKLRGKVDWVSVGEGTGKAIQMRLCSAILANLGVE